LLPFASSASIFAVASYAYSPISALSNAASAVSVSASGFASR
jgi:hypothetical protein